MQCVVFDCCNVRCVDVLLFFEYVVLRSCTANCETPSIFMSQMAVDFSNAVTTDVYLGVFIINAKESSFSSFCPVLSNAFWVCLVYLA